VGTFVVEASLHSALTGLLAAHADLDDARL
jgi:hypothetical protein